MNPKSKTDQGVYVQIFVTEPASEDQTCQETKNSLQIFFSNLKQFSNKFQNHIYFNKQLEYTNAVLYLWKTQMV